MRKNSDRLFNRTFKVFIKMTLSCLKFYSYSMKTLTSTCSLLSLKKPPLNQTRKIKQLNPIISHVAFFSSKIYYWLMKTHCVFFPPSHFWKCQWHMLSEGRTRAHLLSIGPICCCHPLYLASVSSCWIKGGTRYYRVYPFDICLWEWFSWICLISFGICCYYLLRHFLWKLISYHHFAL